MPQDTTTTKNNYDFLSTTNSGDSYYTPSWCYEGLSDFIDFSQYKTAFDPSMGDGRLIFDYLEAKHDIACDGRDLAWKVETQEKDEDFFEWDGYADLIISNPPFSKAQQFIEHAIPRCDTLIFLLRLNFLGSQKRNAMWNANKPDKLIVLSKRPSFNGKGTDSCDYAWFVWQNGEKRIQSGIDWMLPTNK